METHKRSATCGELGPADAGRQVTLNGWVHRKRDHGGITFINLRDRYGITQCVVDPARFGGAVPEALAACAADLRGEYCIAASGVVRPRPDGMVNPDMATGGIEVAVDTLTVLNRAEVPPFPVTEGENPAKEDLRLRYRYLDLRCGAMQRRIALRSAVTLAVRNHLASQGFLEIETPTFIRSTPEGARDYLVPSRLYPGSFYALPQSPQLYKQLLMTSGFDRYFQIARCYRDEDARGDRQPEFTQIDIEMSFVSKDDILALTEGLMARVFRDTLAISLDTPFPRIPYDEAIARFGTDKPDLRFGMELQTFPWAAAAPFPAFTEALAAGGAVTALVAPGLASYSRKQIEALEAVAKTRKAKALYWVKVVRGGAPPLAPNGAGIPPSPAAPFSAPPPSGGHPVSNVPQWHENAQAFSSPPATPPASFEGGVAKFLQDQAPAIIAGLHAAPDDLILICAESDPRTARAALGAVRSQLGSDLHLCDPRVFAFAWIVDFPLFEYNAEEQRWEAAHHLFSYPQERYHATLESDPGAVKGDLYDLVLNGYELASGSIRIHDPELQKRVFAVAGIGPEEAEARFGFLTNAFRYGAPPHGGIAPGLDRLVMLMAGEKSIKEVIAFPKNSFAASPLDDCPAPVDPHQLAELGITVTTSPSEGALKSQIPNTGGGTQVPIPNSQVPNTGGGSPTQ
ncbi:MAG: aspartate--tRNA ligase [Treponema sp.]|jgi:aspartyl-tRNA synthetase|nr:aspartate--tRNA ligase [Treponema sp.]